MEEDPSRFSLVKKQNAHSKLVDDTPVEIIAIILSFLKTSDLVKAGWISQGWRKAARLAWEYKPFLGSEWDVKRIFKDADTFSKSPLSSISHLIVIGKDLSDERLSFFSFIKNVKYLNFGDNKITGKGVEWIVRTWPFLEELDLHDNKDIKKEEVKEIAKLSHLKKLNLSRSSIRAEEIDEIVKNNFPGNLTELSLNWSLIQESEATAIANGNFSKLKVLNLSSNPLKDKGTELIFRGAFPALTTLNLSSTSISKVGITHSPFSQTLVSLNLSQDSIGDKGVKLLFSNNIFPGLTDLNLGDNCINSKGVKEIKCTSLTNLDLSKNSIGNKGAIDIFANDALFWIKRLNLRENSIGDKGVKDIKFLWLTDLDLSKNRITEEGQTKIILNDTLISLTNLNLTGSFLNALQLSQRRESLRTNLIKNEKETGTPREEGDKAHKPCILY